LAVYPTAGKETAMKEHAENKNDNTYQRLPRNIHGLRGSYAKNITSSSKGKETKIECLAMGTQERAKRWKAKKEAPSINLLIPQGFLSR